MKYGSVTISEGLKVVVDYIPKGISSGGIFFSVRRRCDIVCAANELYQPPMPSFIVAQKVAIRLIACQLSGLWGGHTTVLFFLKNISKGRLHEDVN